MDLAEKNPLRKRVRKTAIVLVLLGSLLPPLAANIGVYAQEAGLSGPVLQLNRSFPSFHALLLCQLWGLFGYISPFNYTFQYEVELTDGQTLVLRDLKKESAGKWQSIFFHNESKADNNFYADRRALREYMEYLIRTNGLNPLEIAHRTISIRYRNVLSRDQAAVAGTHYGPEMESVLEDY
jgi:hypothetical protein